MAAVKNVAADAPKVLGDLDAHEAELEEHRDQLGVDLLSGRLHSRRPVGATSDSGEFANRIAKHRFLFAEDGQRRGDGPGSVMILLRTPAVCKTGT